MLWWPLTKYKINIKINTDKFEVHSCIIIIQNILETLRALYLGDNDFETIPPEIGQLKNLQIVSKLKLIHKLVFKKFPYIFIIVMFTL